MSEPRSSLLLARLAQRLRAQDWLAAGIEVVIVVLGVFLGFQVTQWNEERHDRSRERSYMLSVASDLRGDVAEMDENARTAASRMASLDHLLNKAGNWSPPRGYPSSRFLIKVEQVAPFDEKSGYTVGIEAFILSTLDGNRFAYNTLISTGGLDVIRDQKLVRDIQSYYSAVDKVRTFEVSLADNRLRMLDALQEAGISAVSGLSFDDVAALLRDRPALRAATENYWLYANRHLFLTREVSKRGAILAQHIECQYHRDTAIEACR